MGESPEGPMTRASRATALTALLVLGVFVADVGAQPWRPDLGNGRYKNPIIFADYSDPDIIRVGDDYYMTASSFGHVPALPILHSKDLVNWTIVNHAIRRLPPDFDVPQHGNGVWAPSIRAHGGWFYIYYGDPDRGIYVVRTRDIRGEWEPPVLVRAAKGWIDPSPLWDDDGNAYLVHAFARSRSGIKHMLHVNRMSPDGLRLLDEGTLVFMDSVRHPTMEGPKFYRKDGWYYIFAPAGGVPTGWQAVLRSRGVLGPYEDRIVMAQGKTEINGPHQGGWVRTANGEDWFVHFQDRGPYGRIVHLQPMIWRDGWPVIGDDRENDGTGDPVPTHAKPRIGRTATRQIPQTSDEFSARRLGLQWQWNANPQPQWSAVREGALRLFAQPLAGANLWTSGHLLMQKLPAPTFTATTKLTPHAVSAGQTFALTIFGLDYAYVGVRRTASNGYEVVQARATNADRGTVEQVGAPVSVGNGAVWLRVKVEEAARDSARCSFAYSTDGVRFTTIGEPFMARQGRWVGAKVGLVAVSDSAVATSGNRRGFATIDWFRVE
jgi:beta-xylosidase